jgi:four helix bundle protein
MSESIVAGRAFYFALNILSLYKEMMNQKEYIVSKQLIRSATSIGANIEEATAASSRKDFAFKMSIASKEARETRYWLKLLQASDIINDYDFSKLISENTEIIRMLTKIVKTIQTENNEQNSRT